MWQKTLSPADMGKIVERLLGGDVTQDEFGSVEHLQDNFAVELTTLLTNYCHGKVVKVDGKMNITIQLNYEGMALDSCIWNHAGIVDGGVLQDMPALLNLF